MKPSLRLFPVLLSLALPACGATAPDRADADTGAALEEADISCEDIFVIAQIPVKEDSVDAFRATLPAVDAEVRTEAGNIADYVSVSASPTVFTVYQDWASQADFDAHTASPAAAAFLDEVKDMVAGPPVVVEYRRLGSADWRLGDAVTAADRIVVVGTAQVTDAKGAATFRKALPAVIRGTRREPGNLGYEFYEAVGNPLVFTSYEVWSSQDALAAHFSTPHVQAFLAKVMPVLAGPPVLAQGAPIPALN
jgi:quinol monooxygenase YgiN